MVDRSVPAAPIALGSGGFSERLAQLRSPARASATATSGPPSLTERLDVLISPRATPLGPLHLIEQRGAPWRGVSADALEAIALAEAPLDPSHPLFLDTETTGLADGTGTLAFLVGVARVVEGEVRLEQAHLAGPGQERPTLEWLRQHLSQATLVVTFNGKSFDWTCTA